MCGLAGLIDVAAGSPDRELVAEMVRRQAHRGPDGQAVHVDGPVALGHARLSIIDLANGRQPIFNEDHSIAAICNGEIYNHRELRRQLEQRGHRFTTDSDCEVLVHLWEEYGRKMPGHLRGMFALVIYDRNEQIVFGARDRFGQKPLFYHASSTRFAFASEMKALLALPEISREVDIEAVDEFLRASYVASPRTMFRSIRRVPANSWFEVRWRDASLSLETGPCAELPPAADHFHSREDHLECVAAAVEDAVQSHRLADVPVGVFLSGGIDSSLIAAMAAKSTPTPISTFAITFPGNRHDEGPKANLVANAIGAEHQEFPFCSHDLPAIMHLAARQFDQPLANTSVLPLMQLAREASQHVKAVLTGDGGDELFAGYRRYRRLVGFPGRSSWLHHAMTSVCQPNYLARCAPDRLGTRRLRTRAMELLAPASRSAYSRQGWEGWERQELYQRDLTDELTHDCDADIEFNFASERTPLRAALAIDQGPVLADCLLHKADYATMPFGLESRAPLLDSRLAVVAAGLPDELLVTPQTTKVALRAVARNYLPESIVEAPKKGFSMPLDDWLRGELRGFTRNVLLDDSISVPRFFLRQTVERLIAAQDRGGNHAQRLFALLTLELWCREYL